MHKRTILLFFLLAALLLAFTAGAAYTAYRVSARTVFSSEQITATTGQISSIETANLLMSGETISALYIPAALKP